MLAGVELDPGDVVLEYGPGTGAFTADIASLVEAGKGSRYLGIEADVDFYNHLREQFPRLAFSLASVEDALPRLELPRENSVKAVISGLPLTRMPAKTIDLILERTSSLLAPDGVFRAFYYVYSSILPGAFHLRRRLKEVFPRSHISFPVIRNVPPAMVVSGWKS
jgi:phospholipid N-methyltransferase